VLIATVDGDKFDMVFAFREQALLATLTNSASSLKVIYIKIFNCADLSAKTAAFTIA